MKGNRLTIAAMFALSFMVGVTSMFTVVNPLLNTLGGGGQGGNRLVQFSCSCNSFGGLLNLALDGLGELAPLGSGVLMTLICGGALLALQGRIADHVGVLSSFWMTIGLITMTILYSLFGKTYIIEEFGRTHYESVVKIDFVKMKGAIGLFQDVEVILLSRGTGAFSRSR